MSHFYLFVFCLCVHAWDRFCTCGMACFFVQMDLPAAPYTCYFCLTLLFFFSQYRQNLPVPFPTDAGRQQDLDFLCGRKDNLFCHARLYLLLCLWQHFNLRHTHPLFPCLTWFLHALPAYLGLHACLVLLYACVGHGQATGWRWTGHFVWWCHGSVSGCWLTPMVSCRPFYVALGQPSLHTFSVREGPHPAFKPAC